MQFTHIQELLWTWANSARCSKRTVTVISRTRSKRPNNPSTRQEESRTRVLYSLFSLQLGRRGLWVQKTPTFFPQVHLWKHLLIVFEHLLEREAITLPTPLTSYPPKAARCPQQHISTLKYLLGEEELQPTSTHYPPDDGYELCHSQLLGNQKLGFVQERKVFLFLVSLNNYLF